MSLISCPECNQEISDTVENCIKCGFSLKPTTSHSTTNPSTEVFQTELVVNTALDFIFGILYLFLAYQLLFGDGMGEDMTGAAGIFGVIIAIAFLYFVQKLSKAVLGTVARSFDSTFNK
jgi:hypothetical protein